MKNFFNNNSGVSGNVHNCGENEILCIFLSSKRKTVISITNRQEIRDFAFTCDERIGLEVEISFNKVRYLCISNYVYNF
jgi:hypothetical protein